MEEKNYGFYRFSLSCVPISDILKGGNLGRKTKLQQTCLVVYSGN